MFYFIGFHKVSRMAKSFQKSESRILLFRKIKPCAISLLFNLIFQIDYHESSVSQRTPEELGWTVREFLLKNTPHFHHKINEKDIWKGLQDHAGDLRKRVLQPHKTQEPQDEARWGKITLV